MCSNYFYDGKGEYIHVYNLYTLNSLVQDGRGIFRGAIIEKKGKLCLRKVDDKK